MKYLKKQLIIAILISLAIASCDDYVDIEPQGFGIPTAVADIDPIFTNGFVVNFTPSAHFLSDDFNIPFDFQENWIRNNGFPQVLLYRYEPQHIDPANSDQDWNANYRTIGQMNFILDFIDDIEGTEDEINRIKAEAFAVRAFHYFHLVNTYGQPYATTNANDANTGVPIIIGEFGDREQSLERATLSEVYDVIIEDLLAAINLFPTDVTQDNYRMSKLGAYAMLAKTYLAIGEYTLAGDAAENALGIKNTLLDYNIDLEEGADFCFIPPTFSCPNGKFIEPARTDNTEIIFRRGDNRYPGFFDQASFQQTMAAILSDDLTATFDKANDLRYTKRTSDGPFGRILHENDLGAGIRISEMYLIQAEAQARAGNFSTAIDIINTLRAKRFDATLVATDGHKLTASNQTEAIALILQERRRELMFTTIRVQDIRRLNALESANISVTHTVGDGGETKTLDPNSNLWTLSIPPNVINTSNGQIEQNPR